MGKKAKVLIAVLVGALLLTGLGLAATALADEPQAELQAEEQTQPEVTTPREAFVNKVAEVLGAPVEAVEDALVQGRRAAVDQALSNRLDRLVENGKLTEDEAGEISEWWSQRPDVPFLDNGLGKFGGHWGRGMGMGAGRFMMGPRG